MTSSELRGADLRAREASELTWWARVSYSSEAELIFALLSPCCAEGLTQLITRKTAQALPRLRPGHIPYENFICLTCDALLPPTPGIYRDTIRWSPFDRRGEDCVLTLSSWAEVCLNLEPLRSHLWAADKLGEGITLAAKGRFEPLLEEIAPPR